MDESIQDQCPDFLEKWWKKMTEQRDSKLWHLKWKALLNKFKREQMDSILTNLSNYQRR